ncbi:MAG: hypothetical protein JSV81_03300 [Anaerolineales bacterium]|nr:MAG: hypothetical protein JSV81_03300 [Anaerolineales bacterium]
MTTKLNATWTSAGMLIGALLSAPCFVGILLIPLGLGAVMMSGFSMFLDTYRYLFIVAALILLGVSHWGLGHAQEEFRPTRLVWVLTIVAALFILGELAVDPPWARHALVPM